jgi:serine/threonine protein kinase
MKTIDFEELQTAFDTAVNLDGNERDDYLSRLTASDVVLANEVSTLLAFDIKSNDLLDKLGESRRCTGGSAAAELAQLDDTLPTIAGYTLCRRVGSGGQADVFLAKQDSTGQHVAIKVFRGGNIAESLRHRIDAEAKALVRLQLPNVVAILDRGQTACGREFLVTRYITGLPIDLAASKLLGRDPNKVYALFAKVAETLSRVHREGIVHRDLKPSNILVDQDGEPYVLDFGLASVASDPLGKLLTATPAGAFVGTILWASPEQVDSSLGAVSGRSDIYSLAVVMYQALTGRFPYSAAGGIHEVARRIVETAPAPLGGQCSASEPQATRAVEAVLFKALEKLPKRRFQTADEFAVALRRLPHGAPLDSVCRGRRGLQAPYLLALCGAAAAIAVAWPIWGSQRQFLPKSDGPAAAAASAAVAPTELQLATKAAADASVSPLVQNFDDELASFGGVPAGWSQVGSLQTNYQQLERANVAIAGDFALSLGASVDRATRAGFELTLVGADGGSDLTVTAIKASTWSDNESWEVRTPAGSVLRSLPVGTHTFTLRRKGELFTLSADALHQPGNSNNVLASFAVSETGRFRSIRLATNGPAVKLDRLRLHTGATSH